ncbi:Smr/MutS family protein, partial [Acinetobacter baumannii]
MRAEQAAEALTSYLDDAVLGGLQSVRVVHGKGEGVLRKVTHETLRRHPGVKSFREAPSD